MTHGRGRRSRGRRGERRAAGLPEAGLSPAPDLLAEGEGNLTGRSDQYIIITARDSFQRWHRHPADDPRTETLVAAFIFSRIFLREMPVPDL